MRPPLRGGRGGGGGFRGGGGFGGRGGGGRGFGGRGGGGYRDEGPPEEVVGTLPCSVARLGSHRNYFFRSVSGDS